MLLCDRDVRRLCTPGEIFLVPRLEEDNLVFSEYRVQKPLVNPFSEAVSGGGVVGYGLTSAGYDLRLDNEELLVFKNTYGHRIDPKNFGPQKYFDEVFDRRTFAAHQQVVVPSHGYVLGRSYEYIHVPPFLKGRVVGKSTYARCGVIVNTTPLEPGWEGHLTIEISNPTSCDVVLYALEGVAQLEFDLLTARPETDYAAKAGKYQRQIAVTAAVVT
jgi:dCTP deaminase